MISFILSDAKRETIYQSPIAELARVREVRG